WHGQGDANSLTLYGADGRWLIESGYGGDLIGPDAHNLVLIDGVGPPSHLYPGSGGAVWSGAGDITQFLDGGWASIAEGDAREAYGSLTWYREGMKTYPRSPVGKALRQLVFLHPDAANEVPGYFLVHDDIQEDADEHAYEWRFHTASENRIQETGHGLLLENRFNHDHYENLGEPTEQWLYHEFDLAEPGTYHLHAVARAPRYASAYIHTRLDGELVGYGSTGIPFWTTVPISNEPLTLAAGKHVVGLRQSQGPLRVAGVLLTRQDQAPPLSDLEAAGDALFARFDTTTDAAAPWRHVRQAESRCEVAFLRPDPLTISWDPFREQGHWRITEQT
ncbi:MAG TPA: heparinase II/III family protein, partial [Dehalococcoidia bacterium]|nr:heparinase II/III family protein [Dehalococcoidia bacterium]